MITSSFCCFKGLSHSAEQKLWYMGCLSWDQTRFLPGNTFADAKTKSLHLQIAQARKALKAGFAGYFLNRFNGAEKIRTYKEFCSNAVILDIETTGLRKTDRITTVAAMKKGEITVFVSGFDLDDFLFLIRDASLLITFNGTRFDLPFLTKHFGFDFHIPHLDMLQVLNGLGYKGGQKSCEQRLGFKRVESPDINGEIAVSLWHRWETARDRKALEQLILYNAEDVFMLEKLIIKAYNLATRPMPVRGALKSSTNDHAFYADIISCAAL